MQEDERSSTQFYPKHFASDASENDEYLNLASGITMDQEKVVVVRSLKSTFAESDDSMYS